MSHWPPTGIDSLLLAKCMLCCFDMSLLGYTSLGKKVGILIIPMQEKSRDAIFRKEKAPAGCSLLTKGLQTQDINKKIKNVLGHMLNISRNVVFTEEKNPAGCSKLAKDL